MTTYIDPDEVAAFGEDRDDSLGRFWKERKEGSLPKRKARREAALQLLDAMYAWSRRQKRWGQNAGAWVTGMEFSCWAHSERCRVLAYAVGGWWIWSEGVVFISLAKWSKMRRWNYELQRGRSLVSEAEAALRRAVKAPITYYGWLAQQRTQPRKRKR